MKLDCQDGDSTLVIVGGTGERTAQPLVIKRFESELKFEDGEHAVIARINTTTVDRHDEVVLPSGVDLTDFNRNPIVLFGHEDHKIPIGKAPSIVRRPNDLIAKVQFASRPPSLPVMQEWPADTIFDLFKQGILNAFSVGFLVDDMREATTKDRGRFGERVRRVITRWKLLELSVVPLPANQDALVLAISKGMVRHDSWIHDCLEVATACKEFDTRADHQAREKRIMRLPFGRPKPLVLPAV